MCNEGQVTSISWASITDEKTWSFKWVFFKLIFWQGNIYSNKLSQGNSIWSYSVDLECKWFWEPLFPCLWRFLWTLGNTEPHCIQINYIITQIFSGSSTQAILASFHKHQDKCLSSSEPALLLLIFHLEIPHTWKVFWFLFLIGSTSVVIVSHS